MRLVMMGTGTFAEPTFQDLLAGSHPVVGLVTQPDRPIGQESGSTRQIGRGLKAMAADRRIPILQPESINTPEGIAGLRALATRTARRRCVRSDSFQGRAGRPAFGRHQCPRFPSSQVSGSCAGCLGHLPWRNPHRRDDHQDVGLISTPATSWHKRRSKSDPTRQPATWKCAWRRSVDDSRLRVVEQIASGTALASSRTKRKRAKLQS